MPQAALAMGPGTAEPGQQLGGSQGRLITDGGGLVQGLLQALARLHPGPKPVAEGLEGIHHRLVTGNGLAEFHHGLQGSGHGSGDAVAIEGVRAGELLLVAGPVGAGKSTLLAAILGEVPLARGSLSLPPSGIAYCSQVAWVQNMSIRDNILFGRPFERQRYLEVLRRAAIDCNLS